MFFLTIKERPWQLQCNWFVAVLSNREYFSSPWTIVLLSFICNTFIHSVIELTGHTNCLNKDKNSRLLLVDMQHISHSASIGECRYLWTNLPKKTDQQACCIKELPCYMNLLLGESHNMGAWAIFFCTQFYLDRKMITPLKELKVFSKKAPNKIKCTENLSWLLNVACWTQGSKDAYTPLIVCPTLYLDVKNRWRYISYFSDMMELQPQEFTASDKYSPRYLENTWYRKTFFKFLASHESHFNINPHQEQNCHSTVSPTPHDATEHVCMWYMEYTDGNL